MQRMLLSSLLLVLACNLFAQECNCTLTGFVLDQETGKPIPFASVSIDGETKGNTADEHGQYTISNLCKGTYDVSCSHIGCEHMTDEVYVDQTLSAHDFLLMHSEVQLDDIVVKETKAPLKIAQANSSLTGIEFDVAKGQNLGNALKRLNGVNTLNTGATIAKPVIQGLHSSRVLILNNGVRQEGQQWGREHAPEIDPFIADKLTVIKGANGVRYGAGAIGGVILVEPRDLRKRPGIGGEINLQGFSNGRTGVASGMLETQLKGKLPISGRIQGTLKRGGNLQTPDYFLQNTGVSERNFSWGLGLEQKRWDVDVFYSRFFTEIGILTDAHIGNLTDLATAIERGRPIEDGAFDYHLDRPLQRISHELFKVRSNLATGSAGHLSVQWTRQFNRRQEFDAHRPFGELPETLEQPQIELEITTHTADLIWEHRPFNHFEGSIGVQGMHQRNTTDRGGLIPNYSNDNIGVFWIERWRKYPFPIHFEAGVRFDAQRMQVEQAEEAPLNLSYNNGSGSVAAIYQFLQHWSASLSVSTAWRSPNVSELFSDGVHHGSASYELGRSDLQSERAISNSLNIEFDDKKKIQGSLSLYYNLVDDYIYLEPQEKPKLTIRGAFPAFHYQQTNARLMGLDFSLNYQLTKKLRWESKASIIRAKDRINQEDLIYIPADQLENGLRYSFEKVKSSQKPYVQLAMINVFQQSRVPADIDFAPPPPGHTRFNLAGGYHFDFKKQQLDLGFEVENLFNLSYREYLNRFRYFTSELGRNISLRLKLTF